jgi:beta-glucosidase
VRRVRRLILGVAVLAPLAVLALPLSGGGGAGATGRCGAHPWCDTALSPDRRAALVLRAMTLDEKLALLAGTKTANFNARLAGVPRLGIPRALVADGPAGISRGEDGTALTQPGKSEALAMPAPVALAASFDPATARLYGETVGAEARSRGLDVLLGPAMDLVRTPRAGRGFETFGEDPLLSGRIAAAWIRGAQSRGVIATAKHFVAYNQETRRFRTDARVGERALRELYLPPFEAAVRAGVGAVMSSYNRVNGTYMDENGSLLRRVLKGEWRFPGMVVSDFSVGTHGTDTSLKGGLDVELPEAQFYKPELLNPRWPRGWCRDG